MQISRILKHFKDTISGKDLWIKKQINVDYKIFGDKFASFAVAENLLNKGSIVYSFGVGTDISFDLGLIKEFDLKVFAFDPTPKSVKWMEQNNPVPDQLIFKPWGLSNEDKIEEFFPPLVESHDSFSIDNIQNSDRSGVECQVYRLSTIMENLNHSYIDLLKMDIEGKEYDVIEDLLKCGIVISQIVVEFHHRFNKIGTGKTKKAINDLNNKGYKIFFISENREEFSFIKR